MIDETNKETFFTFKEKNIRFTNREIDVISCVLAGRSTKKIASFLSISPKTVENHIRNIMVKLECNSRENIIDYLEQSESFHNFKKHYSKILVQMAFELELKKISKHLLKKSPTCLNIYYSTEKEKPSFIIELEKYLKIAGIIVRSYNWDPEQVNNITTGTESVDYIIYSISKNFAKKFKYLNGKLTIDEFQLNEMSNKNLEIILLLMEKLDDQTYVLVQRILSDHIDINKQTNYYFFIFEILKRILVKHNIEKNIEAFNKQYNSFLTDPIVYNEAVNQQVAENLGRSNYLLNYIINKKLMIIFGLILLVVIFINFVFNKKQMLDITREHLINNIAVTKQKYLKKGLAINLPQRNRNFTGRESILSKIKEELNANNTEFIVKPIVGLGGVGKTQLVVEFAYQTAEMNDYQLILWVAAETNNAIYDSYRKFAEYFEINIKNLTLQEIQLLIHKYIAANQNGKKILFILDNVPNNKFVEKNLINLYRQSSNYFMPHILITSRSQSFPEIPLILEEFSMDEAIKFIKKHLPNESEDDIANLAKELYYFPLALSQATAYIKIHSNISDYLNLYRSNITKYLGKEVDPQHSTSLWETWNITLSKLSDNGKFLVFIGSYLEPDNIPIELFDNLTIAARTDAIKDLRNYSLITLSNNNKSFKIHRLLQEIIRTKNQQYYSLLANSTIDKALELVEKKFDFNYLKCDKWPEWMNYIEHAKLLAEHAIKIGGLSFNRGLTLYAKVAMFKTHILNEFNEDTVKIWLKLLELIKPYTTPISLLGALVDNNLGFALRMTNNLIEAKKYFEHATRIYEQKPSSANKFEQELANILRVISIKGDHINISDLLLYDYCYLLNNLGHLYSYTQLKDPDIAIKYYNQSLKILNELENVNDISRSVEVQKSYLLYHLSRYYVYLNELMLAETLLNTAKQLLEKQDLRPIQQARICSDLATIYYKLGNFKKVDHYLKQAADLLKGLISDQHNLIYLLKLQSGCNAYRLGKTKIAQEILQDSINYWENSNNNYYSWFNIWFGKLHLSKTYESVGKYNQALQLMENVISIVKRQYHDKEKLHKYMKFKGTRAENWQKINKDIPIDYLKNILQLNIELFGENSYQAASYHQLYGQAFDRNKQHQKALEQYQKSMSILKKEEIKHQDLVKFHNQNIQLLQNLIKSSGS